ncbi:hypothetical protein V8G54_009217 [Vigna mungo]|uniref:Uncharacterized protein n=1 Tax=Vigna mungo TaxID=3915 RepID=A0AAQ3NUQ9_VIGMU
MTVLWMHFGVWLIRMCFNSFINITSQPSLYLHCRYSLSVNGNFLNLLGNGAADCGGYYSRLLQEYDALVMSSSFFTENFKVPASQEPGANQPIRIVIHKDPNSLNQILSSINDITSKIIIFTENKAGTAPEVAQQGIEIVALDQINLDVILDYCNSQGLCSVLLDIRGSFSEFEVLVMEAMEKNYINKFITEFLPVWNKRTEPDPLQTLKSLEQGMKVLNLKSKTSDQSVVIEGYFKSE